MRLYHGAAVSVFERQALSNGVRVLTAPMPQAQSVTCSLMLAAGSRYETRDTNGIAHFAEHMFFKGTERRPTAREIAGEIDAIGGEFNAFTGKEYTGYYVKCAAEHRDIALDVLVDMIRNSRFDPEEVEREKGVIVEEMNMYFDTPRDFIGGVYDELLYDDQPLGWDIIGRKETVRAATRETFLDYIERWYKPERLVVGLGGKIEGDAIERLEELLGDLDGHAAAGPPTVQISSNGAARVKLHTKASDQAHVCLGVRSYPLEHPDRYVLQLLATVLGGGMSSRLFSEVRERRGLAYYVFGLNHSYTDAGSLYSQAGVDINRIDEAVSTIARELRRVAEEPIPADELEKARNFAKGRFVLQLESPQGLILFGLRKEVLENRAPDPEEVLAGVDAVTAEDVQRVARDLIDDEKLRLALIGPFDDAERFEALL
jgi:predicted Zn-dependent peptidase